MSGFWAQALGAPPAPSVPQVPVTQRLAPAALPQPAYVPPAAQEQPPSQKAASARQTELCPACGSGNYMSVLGARTRCYDCGYPVEQSTSGVTSTGSSQGAATAAPAQQAPGYSGGFQPHVIVNK